MPGFERKKCLHQAGSCDDCIVDEYEPYLDSSDPLSLKKQLRTYGIGSLLKSNLNKWVGKEVIPAEKPKITEINKSEYSEPISQDFLINTLFIVDNNKSDLSLKNTSENCEVASQSNANIPKTISDSISNILEYQEVHSATNGFCEKTRLATSSNTKAKESQESSADACIVNEKETNSATPDEIDIFIDDDTILRQTLLFSIEDKLSEMLNFNNLIDELDLSQSRHESFVKRLFKSYIKKEGNNLVRDFKDFKSFSKEKDPLRELEELMLIPKTEISLFLKLYDIAIDPEIEVRDSERNILTLPPEKLKNDIRTSIYSKDELDFQEKQSSSIVTTIQELSQSRTLNGGYQNFQPLSPTYAQMAGTPKRSTTDIPSPILPVRINSVAEKTTETKTQNFQCQYDAQSPQNQFNSILSSSAIQKSNELLTPQLTTNSAYNVADRQISSTLGTQTDVTQNSLQTCPLVSSPNPTTINHLSSSTSASQKSHSVKRIVRIDPKPWDSDTDIPNQLQSQLLTTNLATPSEQTSTEMLQTERCNESLELGSNSDTNDVRSPKNSVDKMSKTVENTSKPGSQEQIDVSNSGLNCESPPINRNLEEAREIMPSKTQSTSQQQPLPPSPQKIQATTTSQQFDSNGVEGPIGTTISSAVASSSQKQLLPPSPKRIQATTTNQQSDTQGAHGTMPSSAVASKSQQPPTAYKRNFPRPLPPQLGQPIFANPHTHSVRSRAAMPYMGVSMTAASYQQQPFFYNGNFANAHWPNTPTFQRDQHFDTYLVEVPNGTVLSLTIEPNSQQQPFFYNNDSHMTRLPKPQRVQATTGNKQFDTHSVQRAHKTMPSSNSWQQTFFYNGNTHWPHPPPFQRVQSTPTNQPFDPRSVQGAHGTMPYSCPQQPFSYYDNFSNTHWPHPPPFQWVQVTHINQPFYTRPVHGAYGTVPPLMTVAYSQQQPSFYNGYWPNPPPF